MRGLRITEKYPDGTAAAVPSGYSHFCTLRNSMSCSPAHPGMSDGCPVGTFPDCQESNRQMEYHCGDFEIDDYRAGVYDGGNQRCGHDGRVQLHLLGEDRERAADQLGQYNRPDQGTAYYKSDGRVLVHDKQADSVRYGQPDSDDQRDAEFLEHHAEYV